MFMAHFDVLNKIRKSLPVYRSLIPLERFHHYGLNMQMSLKDLSQNSLNLYCVESKKLFYYTSQWFLSSSRLQVLFLNLGLVGLLVFHIDKSQIDMILSAFSSHRINKAYRGKLKALSFFKFICLIVCLSIYSLIPFLGSRLKEDYVLGESACT